MNILALDVGTSSVKAAVLDTATTTPVGAIARTTYALDNPVPDAAEVPAQRLWEATAAAARAAMRSSGVSGKAGQDVQAVGLSCLTPALVLLDKKDRPLRPIWTHLDRRARSSARQVWGAVGPEFLATIGNRPLPGGISVLCLRQMLIEDPYLLHEVRCYMHANGWLALHMTGERAFDPANASFTGLFGTLTDRQWSQRWCDYFEVDKGWLPPVVSGDTTIGTLRPDSAAELGVPAGVPCKLGTADTSSAMLAAGMQPGDLLHELGTTQVLAVLTDKPVPSPRRLTRLLGVAPSPLPLSPEYRGEGGSVVPLSPVAGDRCEGVSYVQVTHNPVGGVALDWLHELCFRDVSKQDFFAKIIPEAMKRSTRVTLDPPFLGGDRLEIEAHRAGFRDLELTTDRLDLAAAVLEAMVRRHGEALACLGQPAPFRRIFLSGGGADLIRRLLPEYHAANVEEIHEGSLRGVAKLFEQATDGQAMTMSEGGR
jgi:sugar (pentulose or hexulose) kinase